MTDSTQTTGSSPKIYASTYFVYATPNRCEDIDYFASGGAAAKPTTEESMSIGTTAYWRDGNSQKWVKTKRDPGFSAEPSYQAASWFTPPLNGTRVQGFGNVFYSFAPPSMLYPRLGGPVTYRSSATTILDDGRVASEELVRILSGRSGDAGVERTTREIVTYSAFGTSPPIVAPPSSDVSR